MKKYVSLDKRSKKAKKEYYAGFRRSWEGMNPVTRTMPNGKEYNRKKDKEKLRKIDGVSERDMQSIFCISFLWMLVWMDNDNKQIIGTRLTNLSAFI